jgi:hypothetical protein
VGANPKAVSNGGLIYFQSLIQGLLSQDGSIEGSGKIPLTKIFLCDEPPLS